jgi:hypothetical protein
MDIFKHLKDNKAALIAQKKFTIKQADSIYLTPTKEVANVNKSLNDVTEQVDLESIKVKVVINATNLLDSHGDVHIPGIWTKSLKEQKSLYLLQEHQMCFDKIITDNLKASVSNMSWSDLGYPELKGTSQVLIFDCEIDSDRNEFMFEQYLKGYVKQHSVGMQYVNLFLCINSEEKYYREEKDNWDKYIKEVVNKDDAISQGYFWAVTEAKIVEGSAVVKGSNFATPTISVTTNQIKEADIITSEIKTEPTKVTQLTSQQQFFINQLKN